MDREAYNIFTMGEFYLIMSTLTGKPYIDQNYDAYMFETKSDASAFCSSIEGTEVKNAEHYRIKEHCTEFYNYGIQNINIKRVNDEIVKVPMLKSDVKEQRYYNPIANGNILRLKQTLKKQYLRNLKEAVFLAPVNIEIRYKKQFPRVNYSYASFTNGEQFFILFTDLIEFEKWNESQNNIWKPMELDLRRFGRIRKEHAVLINPLSDKLILSNKQIKIALEKEKL